MKVYQKAPELQKILPELQLPEDAGIHSEEALGAFAIEMDILPVLESLPEEIYDLLSEKKVGTYMVEQENGVFTEEGYCFRFEEGWNDVYDEKI